MRGWLGIAYTLHTAAGRQQSAKHLVKIGAAAGPRLRHVWVHPPRRLLVVVCSTWASSETDRWRSLHSWLAACQHTKHGASRLHMRFVQPELLPRLDA